jgi:hypothetical protein
MALSSNVLIRFNPTLVRLRPALALQALIAVLRFNPTLVRLRRISGRPILPSK